MMLVLPLRLGFWSSTKALTNREAIDVSDSDGYHVDATAKWKEWCLSNPVVHVTWKVVVNVMHVLSPKPSGNGGSCQRASES